MNRWFVIGFILSMPAATCICSAFPSGLKTFVDHNGQQSCWRRLETPQTVLIWLPTWATELKPRSILTRKSLTLNSWVTGRYFLSRLQTLITLCLQRIRKTPQTIKKAPLSWNWDSNEDEIKTESVHPSFSPLNLNKRLLRRNTLNWTPTWEKARSVVRPAACDFNMVQASSRYPQVFGSCSTHCTLALRSTTIWGMPKDLFFVFLE